jgi:transcription antitermination factor NusG
MKTKMLYLILFIIVVALFIEVSKQFIKENNKNSKLQCQKEVVFFDKVLQKDLVTDVKNNLYNGNFIVNIDSDKAKFMKSKLFDYVKLNETKNYVEKYLLTLKTNNFTKQKQKTVVDIVVYENDKMDPKKKSSSCKLFTGYIVITFLINDQSVYKAQIDFIDSKGKDIPKRIQCTINSLMNL